MFWQKIFCVVFVPSSAQFLSCFWVLGGFSFYYNAIYFFLLVFRFHLLLRFFAALWQAQRTRLLWQLHFNNNTITYQIFYKWTKLTILFEFIEVFNKSILFFHTLYSFVESCLFKNNTRMAHKVCLIAWFYFVVWEIKPFQNLISISTHRADHRINLGQGSPGFLESKPWLVVVENR